jgi:sortase A
MNKNDTVPTADIASAQPVKPRKARFLRILGLVLMLSGIAVIGYPATTFLVTTKAQDKLRADWNRIVKESTKNLDSKASSSDSAQSSNSAGNSSTKKIPAGKAAFRLIIPKLDLDRIVVEGTDTASLKLGPGHMSKTTSPGEPGVCVVSGHRTTYGAPFFRLDRMKNGDQIIVETTSARFIYIVYDTRTISPKNTSFITKNGDPLIALTTCTPIHSARQRLVILAKLAQ